MDVCLTHVCPSHTHAPRGLETGEPLQVKIRQIDDANVTPADYSIMVRGLPKDITKEEASFVLSWSYWGIQAGRKQNDRLALL